MSTIGPSTINPVEFNSGEESKLNPPVAIPAMGKPPFEASEGGHLMFLRSGQDFTFGEFQFVKGYGVLFL